MTKKTFWTWIIVIAVIHVGLILLFGMKKEGFHEDEYYSYWSSAVPGDVMKPVNFSWHSGYELQRRFLVGDDRRFDYETVIQNQCEDVHPPLYYLALHTFMSLFPNCFYKWFGILLNLLFSLISYGCIVALFYYMSEGVVQKREFAALLAGFIYATAPSTVSAVMLTRMYAMSTMWSTAYTLVLILLMINRRCGKRRFGFLLFCGALSCYCAFLTHYFSLIIPFFLTLAYSVYTLLRRNGIVRMLIWGTSMAAAIALGVLSYPASLQHIFSGYRGTGAIQGLFGGSLPMRLSIFTGYMQTWIFSGTLYPCLIAFVAAFVFLLVLAIRKKGWKTVRNFVCRMAAVFFALLMSYVVLCGTSMIVGSASCRYFYPVAALLFPFIAYTLFGTFSVLGGNIGKFPVPGGIITVCITVLALIPTVFGYCKKNVLFLYEEDEDKVAFSREYSEYPLIMVYGSSNSYRSWYVDNQLWPFEQVFYLSYEQRDALDDKTLQEADKIVVYMDAPEDLLENLIANNPNLSTYTLVRHDPFFYVYLLE